jgi:hypothetical protein
MFTLVTWNIYYGPFKNVDHQWDGLEWPARREKVLAEIDKLQMDRNVVFCLQEVSESGSLPDITKSLERTHHIEYLQTSPLKIGVLTAIPKTFEIYSMSMDTSRIQRPEGWFPGYILSMFSPPVGEDEFHPDPILLINMHASTKASAREMICRSMTDEINYLKSLSQKNILWCGDFNSFPDAGGVELFYDLQRRAGLYEATSVMVSAYDPSERVLKTFQPYPDDQFMPKTPLLPYHLDHILLGGDFNHGSPKCHNRADGSDHFPVELTLSLATTKN